MNVIKKVVAIQLIAVSSFVLFAVCAPKPVYASAKSIEDLKLEKDKLLDSETATQQRLDETRNELSKVIAEIQALISEIDESEAELERIMERLEKTNADLKKTEKELADAQEELEEHYETLKVRIQYFHENGEVSYIKVIMQAKSFSDFLNRAQYIRDIMDYDEKVMNDLEIIEATIETKKVEIENQKREIENLARQEADRKESLEASKKVLNEKVKQLEEDEALFEQRLIELEEASNEVEALIKKAQQEEEARRRAAEAQARAQSGGQSYSYNNGSGGMVGGSVAYVGGKFQWPVPGRTSTSSDYYARTNPITGRSEFHTGIDIPAPYGTNIVAAESGIVITSGWVGGYGNTIMIDHGSGIVTLYGHNSSLVAAKGDYVSRGETVALCGSTGMSTGNHCHFEVRVNGKHTSPWPYLR